jgi:tetratricopeptide (TPR) repeat protein
MAVIDAKLLAANESIGPARLQTVERIFHEALERGSGPLAAFLEEACAGDESLRREVEALLVSHRQAEGFIEKPVVTLDARIFEDVQANTLIGQTIGQYRISKQIGAGGMGTVYLARRADHQYEKLVAIKLIKRGMDTDAVLRHFHTERQILASFDHPNIALREGFVVADPHSPVHRRNLSFTYVNIGRALFQSGDIKGALESNQKGLAIRDALFAENPSNADYRRLLAISYQNDGKYRALLHDVGGALLSFHKKLLLNEQSLADDPLDAQAREDLGYSYERIGDLLARSGDYAKALLYYRRALSLYEKVWSVAPRIWRVHYRAVFSRAGIAKMQANLGNKAIALGECSKVSALLNEIPEVPESRLQSGARAQINMHLAKVYATLATSRIMTGAEQRKYWRTARNIYARSLEIWQEMETRGILTGEYAAKPREVAREIARCDSFLRN